MSHRIRYYWEAIRTSFWFLPAVMSACAAVLALALVELDDVIQTRWVREAGWFYTGSAEGARQLLATVAGSMITVAGVVFSITTVALSLASTQFGPRLLRNFMRDRGNQVVLGTFIATFVYCLLVLRTVRGQDDLAFVPHLSVTVAVLLALASLGVLIYFIHHAATSMQAPHVIANVAGELHRSIDTLFPETLGEGAEEGDPDGTALLDFEREGRPVPAPADGYIQLIDEERLMRLASERDLLVRLVHRPGHFVARGTPLAVVWPGERAEAVAEAIQDTFVLGPQQTPTQDVVFALGQLTEVAVRALSPGINDPFTATTCLDRLGAALSRLAGRKIPSPYRRDDRGRVRVVAYPFTFADAAETAFGLIRQHGRGSAAVLVRMLETIVVVLPSARRPEDRAALLRHALLIAQSAGELPQEADRQEVAAAYERVLEVVQKAQEKQPRPGATRSGVDRREVHFEGGL